MTTNPVTGWKLVPIEPTGHMIGCVNWSGPLVGQIRDAHGPNTVSSRQAKLVYEAMLAATPTPPNPVDTPSNPVPSHGVAEEVEAAARIIDPMPFSMKPEQYTTGELHPWVIAGMEIARKKARKVFAMAFIYFAHHS